MVDGPLVESLGRASLRIAPFQKAGRLRRRRSCVIPGNRRQDSSFQTACFSGAKYPFLSPRFKFRGFGNTAEKRAVD